jgi:hypothetical protein
MQVKRCQLTDLTSKRHVLKVAHLAATTSLRRCRPLAYARTATRCDHATQSRDSSQAGSMVACDGLGNGGLLRGAFTVFDGGAPGASRQVTVAGCSQGLTTRRH